MSLTNKQKAFVAEYIKDLNGTQAVYRAGYNVDNDNSAGVIAHENLRKPKIKAEIERYLDEATMSAKEVLFELTLIAKGDMGQLVDQFGTPDFKIASQNHKTKLIKKIKTKTVYSNDDSEIHSIEFELYDRLRALDLLAKYHQLTTTTQVKTWRDDAIEAIKNGDVDYEGFMKMFDDADLAKQLFLQAGVPIAG